jgi:hypothetical protein
MMEHDAYIFVHQGWLEVEPEVAWAMGGSISLIKFGFRLVLTGVCFRSCDYGGYIGALHYWRGMMSLKLRYGGYTHAGCSHVLCERPERRGRLALA